MPDCVFCRRDAFRNVLVDSDEAWYAFVPRDCLLYGHLVLTTDKGHCQNIELVEPDLLAQVQGGVSRLANRLLRLKNVERVYVSALGESRDVHFHYHLIPRFKFVSDRERGSWAREYVLSQGRDYWRYFYAHPTLDFQFRDGFQYLGEAERTYNEVLHLLSLGEPPEEEVTAEIAAKLRGLRLNRPLRCWE